MKAKAIFLDRQKHNGALMFLSTVWYVQCFAKRLTLNSIEFLHSQVWRSVRFSCIEKFMKNWLDNNNMGRVFAKSHRFRFKTVQFSVELLAFHRKFNGNIILVQLKTDYTNPKQAVDGYLKK